MTDTTHQPRLMMPPRVGVLLPNFDAGATARPLPIVPAARLAEELGFGAAWVGDHLACPAPGLDAPSCLAAAAAVTENIRLGLSVMLLGLRAPAWAAKILATIDHLSSGRLVLGVGVGGAFPAEFEAAGVPVRQRGARLDDALHVIRDLLTGNPVTYEGRAITVTAPSLQPAMATPPPIYIGGRGEAALQRAARPGGLWLPVWLTPEEGGGRGEAALHRAARHGDMWLPMWLTPEKVADRTQQLADLAERQGRPAPGT